MILNSQNISFCPSWDIIKMSETYTDLVTATPVSSEEMTYSNKVYLSP